MALEEEQEDQMEYMAMLEADRQQSRSSEMAKHAAKKVAKKVAKKAIMSVATSIWSAIAPVAIPLMVAFLLIVIVFVSLVIFYEDKAEAADMTARLTNPNPAMHGAASAELGTDIGVWFATRHLR